jgi:biotin operon repressor
VFTESRDTLEYLVKQLRKWGYAVTELHGGMELGRAHPRRA